MADIIISIVALIIAIIAIINLFLIFSKLHGKIKISFGLLFLGIIFGHFAIWAFLLESLELIPHFLEETIAQGCLGLAALFVGIGAYKMLNSLKYVPESLLKKI